MAIAEDLEEALELISSNPFIGALARDVELAGVRRVLLNRVGYYVYYRVLGERPRSVQVVAFWHARRVSGPKL